MLALAHAQARHRANVTLTWRRWASGLPVEADAALLYFTHDIMRTPGPWHGWYAPEGEWTVVAVHSVLVAAPYQLADLGHASCTTIPRIARPVESPGGHDSESRVEIRLEWQDLSRVGTKDARRRDPYRDRSVKM
jgi:hypothetical protein